MNKLGWKQTKLKRITLVFLNILMFYGVNAQIKIEAEHFVDAISNSSEIIMENENKSVGYFDEEGELLKYSINIEEAGYYRFSYRYLAGSVGAISIEVQNGAVGSISFKSFDLDEWWTVPFSDWKSTNFSDSPLFYLSKGEQIISIKNLGTPLNIDYFQLEKSIEENMFIDHIESFPKQVVIMPGEKVHLSAVAYNSTGDIIAAPISWPTNAPNGIYMAGNNSGTDIVTVTVGSIPHNIIIEIANAKKKQNFVVTRHGKLNTNDGAVRDESGNRVSLMGPSFFWSCSAATWWTKETVDFLVSEYNVQVIRLPVSIAPWDESLAAPWTNNGASTWNKNNYYHNPSTTLALADEVIKAAIENDIYVIIDFHEHYAQHWVELSKSFFTHFAKKWGEYPNILYEIFNEPKYDDSNETVIEYARQVIPVIRSIDPDNVIIVGSPKFSRQPDQVTAAGYGYSNIAYTWHGYVEWSHQGDWTGKNWNNTNGTPIVVTEWGMDWNNEGGLLDIYKNNQVIHTFWSINNKGNDDEKWSVLKTGCTKVSGWTDSDLTDNGRFLLNRIRTWVNYKPESLFYELAVNAGSDIDINLPFSSVTLRGNASGGTNIYSYRWKQISGPSVALLDGETESSVLVSNLQEGTYVFSFAVYDGNETEEDNVSIIVLPEGVKPSKKEGLIDDVEDGNTISLWGGNWDTFDDSDKGADISSVITKAEDLPYNQTIKADFIMGKQWLGDGWLGDPFCGIRLSLTSDGTVWNLANCEKITYKFRGAAHEFRVEMKSVLDDDYHSVSVPASTDWITVEINWNSLEQAKDWGADITLDKSNIRMFSWQLKLPVETIGSIEIDDVMCEGAKSPVNNTTSIPEIETERIKKNIYPNPCMGKCFVNLKLYDTVSIYTLQGVLIDQFNAEFDEVKELNLQSGIYIICVNGFATKVISY